MIHKTTGKWRIPHLLLRLRAAFRISSFTCLLPLGIDGRGRGRLHHLLDLLGDGGGEAAAAQQVPGRAGRADEATGVIRDDDSLVLLLPFLAVVPVCPGLGRNVSQGTGTGTGTSNGLV